MLVQTPILLILITILMDQVTISSDKVTMSYDSHILSNIISDMEIYTLYHWLIPKLNLSNITGCNCKQLNKLTIICH